MAGGRIGLVAAVVAALLASAASAAAEYDRSRLFAAGAWEVSHIWNDRDGHAWCAATTARGNGTSVSVNVSEVDVELQFYDDGWRLGTRGEPVRIDVDYEVYWAQASLTGGSVFVRLDDLGPHFLGDLARKNAVALYTVDGRRLMTFSLRGSARALAALSDCARGLTARHDPFRRAGSVDPF